MTLQNPRRTAIMLWAFMLMGCSSSASDSRGTSPSTPSAKVEEPAANTVETPVGDTVDGGMLLTVADTLSMKRAMEASANPWAPLPFSGSDVAERVVMDHGNRAVRATADQRISLPELVRERKNLFIVMSKKDFYLYVYEPQGADTVLIARYDVAFSLHKGQKTRQGDMRTPHCTTDRPFKISQIQDASTWRHDFKDGRGNILSYGHWFLRLATPMAKGIGIHGSTNNRESVPGRASEGCIRLLDEDIRDLHDHYAFLGMKVIIKDEGTDDLPFERRAMRKQSVKRVRHFDPATTLSNEQIKTAKLSTR